MFLPIKNFENSLTDVVLMSKNYRMIRSNNGLAPCVEGHDINYVEWIISFTRKDSK